LKITALRDPRIRAELESSDSMAWSFAARREGRNGNDPREAHAFTAKIAAIMTAHAETASGLDAMARDRA
jgi:hypothetical protein